jgi:predicted transcriptional regulator
MAGISGGMLCSKAKIDRSRLSKIECGYILPSDSEIKRIAEALEDLLTAKKKLVAVAAELGWPTHAL